MKPTQCLFNSRTALFRVFVSPFEPLEAARLSLSRGLTLSSQTHSPTCRPTSSLPITTGVVPARSRNFHATPLRCRPREPAKPDRLPIDLEIKDKRILLLDDQNRAKGPFSTVQVLRNLDMSVEMLRMITPAANPDEKKPGAAAAGPSSPAQDKKKKAQAQGPRYAICKIVNKEEERRREAQKAKEKKAKAKATPKQKEVEMGWAIAEHDRQIKLGRAREFLEKGYKVDIVFARKRGARAAERDEMEGLVKSVRALLVEVPGVRERKAAEGDMGRTMRFCLEGQMPKQVKEPKKAKQVEEGKEEEE